MLDLAEWPDLHNEHSQLVWDIHWREFLGLPLAAAQTALRDWEIAHADEWNRLKPWYERRLTP